MKRSALTARFDPTDPKQAHGAVAAHPTAKDEKAALLPGARPFPCVLSDLSDGRQNRACDWVEMISAAFSPGFFAIISGRVAGLCGSGPM